MSDGKGPARIWAEATEVTGSVVKGVFSDTVRQAPMGVEYVRADIVGDLLAAHEENARILGYLVNELQGIVQSGKIGALALCLERSKDAIAAGKKGIDG